MGKERMIYNLVEGWPKGRICGQDLCNQMLRMRGYLTFTRELVIVVTNPPEPFVSIQPSRIY